MWQQKLELFDDLVAKCSRFERKGKTVGKIYFLVNILPINIESKWKEIIHQSDHLFVEVLEDDSFIYERPSLLDTTKSAINKGSLLLLSGVSKHENLLWNKVLVDEKKWGWIIRVKPAEIGIPEKRDLN